MREEARRQRLEKGVLFAMPRTGGVIASAALLLAGTFAVLTKLPMPMMPVLELSRQIAVIPIFKVSIFLQLSQKTIYVTFFYTK